VSGVNLIPPDLLGRREARRALRRWIARLGLTLALLSLFYSALARLAAGQLGEVDRVSGRYASLSERLQSADALIQERNRLVERRSLIGFIREELTAYSLINALGAALTPEVYLTHLSVARCAPEEQEQAAPRGEPCRPTLMLRGHAPGHREVGELLRRLGVQPVFRAVSLVSVNDPAEPGGAGGVDFEMLCELAEEAPHD
jgi:hypothetical protein